MLSCIHFTCNHFSLVISVDNIKSSVFPFICNICRTLLSLNKENSMKYSDFGKFLLFFPTYPSNDGFLFNYRIDDLLLMVLSTTILFQISVSYICLLSIMSCHLLAVFAHRSKDWS